MKIKYYINKEKGTVVAKMEKCKYDTFDLLLKDGLLENANTKTSIEMMDTYSGKAKLNPEDEWNEEEGKRVARNKMLLKYYNKRCKILDSCYKELSDILTRIYKRILYCMDKIQKAKENQL